MKKKMLDFLVELFKSISESLFNSNRKLYKQQTMRVCQGIVLNNIQIGKYQQLILWYLEGQKANEKWPLTCLTTSNWRIRKISFKNIYYSLYTTFEGFRF